MLFSKKTEVVFDTNALLLPSEGVDIFTLVEGALLEPHTLCTYDLVLTELETLMAGKKKESFAAKLGYILSKQKALKTLQGSSGRHADDAIVEGSGPKTIVVTQDKELIKRLRTKGIRVLRFQQGKAVFVP